MCILFLTDNFPPEVNAPATRTFEHAKEWVKMGHEVTVITSAPNFPFGRVFSGFKNSWIDKRKEEGIEVWRVKTYIAANEGVIKRTIDYLSFMISSFIFGLGKKDIDVIIGTSPQFFTVLSAWALSKIKKVPFIFELRDLWPESIAALGAVKNKWLLSFLEKIELFLYKESSLIITVTQSFKNNLIERGIKSNKIKVIPNGADTSKLFPGKRHDTELSSEFNIKNEFIAGYIGTHGMAHGIDSIVEAAVYLQKYPEIRILLAGSGSERERIEYEIKNKQIKNIILIPQQPKEKIRELWSLCDISIIHLKNLPIFKTVIPSKIFESIAMEIPLVISIPRGEATQIVLENKIGIVVEPENSEELANAIIKMKKDNDMRLLYSKNCRESIKKYNREELAKNYIKYISTIVE